VYIIIIMSNGDETDFAIVRSEGRRSGHACEGTRLLAMGRVSRTDERDGVLIMWETLFERTCAYVKKP